MSTRDTAAREVPLRDWLKVRHVASVWGVTPEQVREWCRTGRVICTQTPGNQWRIHPDEARPR